jgi:hypothetical protein
MFDKRNLEGIIPTGKGRKRWEDEVPKDTVKLFNTNYILCFWEMCVVINKLHIFLDGIVRSLVQRAFHIQQLSTVEYIKEESVKDNIYIIRR